MYYAGWHGCGRMEAIAISWGCFRVCTAQQLKTQTFVCGRDDGMQEQPVRR
jgi:hypothetical protein